MAVQSLIPWMKVSMSCSTAAPSGPAASRTSVCLASSASSSGLGVNDCRLLIRRSAVVPGTSTAATRALNRACSPSRLSVGGGDPPRGPDPVVVGLRGYVRDVELVADDRHAGPWDGLLGAGPVGADAEALGLEVGRQVADPDLVEQRREVVVHLRLDIGLLGGIGRLPYCPEGRMLSAVAAWSVGAADAVAGIANSATADRRNPRANPGTHTPPRPHPSRPDRIGARYTTARPAGAGAG